MKNLKKVLALVLAFACAFTMFAGAAFTDQADIEAAEAVDMLTALGVIDGYEDGSFQPNETVTRAEMAKMIYTIRNGGNATVTQYEGYKTPFADVENTGHWAKGYIAYCYANGIIDGKSATSFDPDATVTGTEAAKMALVLIGYDAKRAGLEGTSWTTNTINLATQKDLFKDFSISITGGCDRQYAAQLLYNTLWACTVRWSADAEDYEDVTVASDSTDGVTIGLLNVTVAKKYMGLEEVKGTYQGDNKINTGLKDNESKVGGKTITFVPEEGNDLVGESVKVLYKENKNGVNGLDPKDTIYGITLSGDTTTVKATLGDIGDDDNGKIKVDDTKYDVYENGMDVVVNFVPDGHGSRDAAEFTDGANSYPKYKQDSADTVKFVLNENGDVISAYITHVDFYEVTGLTSSKITLAGLGTMDIDDNVDLDDSVEAGDAVALTTLYAKDYDDDDALNVITKAEVASDVTVDAMRNQGKANAEVRIDGSYAKHANNGNDHLSEVASGYVAVTTVDLDGTYDFVMYNGYWVAAKEIEAASENIALVTRTTGTQGSISDQVKVMMADGSETVYDLDDGNSTDKNLSIDKIEVEKLYAYTLTGDNGIQLKNDVAGLSFVDDNSISYNEDNKVVTTKAGSRVTADDAVAFVLVEDDYYTYKMDDLKSFGGNGENANKVTAAQYVVNDDNEIVALFAELDRKPGATTSNDEYGYVITDASTTSNDGDKYQTFTVWNGTDEVEINVKGDSTDVVKGDFVKYAIDSNNIADSSDIKILTKANVGAVYTYNANRQLLTLADGKTSANTYAVADDVVIIGVNTNDKEAAEGYNTVFASKDSNGKYLNNIVYVLNDDGEVVVIFTDVNNELYNKGENDRAPIFDHAGEAVKG